MIERGKIKSVKLGAGGYQDAMFGFTFTLGGKSWGVGDFWGTWAEHSEYCKWTVAEQNKAFLNAFLKVKQLMADAGVASLHKLEGVPVEVEFEGDTLKSWRIMTEVL